MSREERKAASLKELLTVFLISLILFTLIYRAYPGHVFDEGQITVGAMRVLNGQVIYRDFFKFLPPGSVYLMALLYSLFGMSLSVNLATQVVTFSLIAVLVYYIAIRLTGSAFISAVSLIYFLTVEAPTWYLISHHWFSTCTALFALVFLIKFIENPDRVNSLPVCGIWLGATVIFLHNKGILMFMAFLLVIALRDWSMDATEKAKRFAFNTVRIIAGAMIPVLPFIVYLAFKGALEEMFYDLFIWVRESYLSFNRYPYYFSHGIRGMKSIYEAHPFPQSLYLMRTLLILALAPLAGIILTLLIAILDNIKGRKDESFKELACAISSLALTLSIWYRADPIHILFTMPLNFTLFLFGLQRVAIYLSGSENKTSSVVLPVILFLLLVDCGYIFIKNLTRLYSKNAIPIYTPAGRLFTMVGREEAGKMQRLYDFFGELEPRDGELFVYSRKDNIYFYLNLLPPTPYDDLLPGHNTREQLLEAVSYLEKNKPEYVVNDNMVDAIIKDKAGMSYPMANLDDFINDPVTAYVRENYEPVPVGAVYEILKRRKPNKK